jgi:hypothetical protein
MPGIAPWATVNWSITATPSPAWTRRQTVVPNRALIGIR